MIFDFVNFFLGFFNRAKIPYIYQIFFKILLFPVILSLPIIPSLNNKETLPMNIPKLIPAEYFKENTDLFLISTKDGYLHALNRNNKQIWKTFLEQELMSYPFSPRKLGKDFYLYPFEEQLYIYKDGEFISFNIFIKDLVKKHFLSIDDFTLLGQTKTTLFIIDLDSGEIIQKIDDENNFSFKKRYILSKNKNTITVIRVDYILNCLGLGEEQKFWNVTYSDILIQKGNENLPDYIKYISPNIKDIIYDYNKYTNDNYINYEDIITAYSYFNKDFPPIKIFDRTDSQRILKLDKSDEKIGEIKQLTEYNNQIKNNFGNIDIDIKIKALESINNNNLIKQDKDINNKIENNNKIIINESKYKFFLSKIKNNWYLYVIIIFLLFELYYYKFFYYIFTKREKKEYQEKFKLKNDNIINRNKKADELNNNNKIDNENHFILDEKYNYLNKRPLGDNKTVSIEHKNNLEIFHSKKYSYDVLKKQKRTKNKNDIKTIKEEKKDNDKKEINKKDNKNEILENKEKEDKNEIIKSKFDDDSREIKDEKENSKLSNKNNTGNGIWDDDEDEDNEDINKDMNNKEKENEIKKEFKKSEKISKNKIWDDDEEESEENEEEEKYENKEREEKIKSNNNSNKISKSLENDEDSYEYKETNENTNSKIYRQKKEKKVSRLDIDFENLEKIGEGGFAIVLKGKHKIDNDIYAIKIIDITNNSKECEEIISEAKKMNSIKGEYIVNYAICWYDDNLGSAEKFFSKEENFPSVLKSSINLTKRAKSKIFKSKDEIFNIKEENEEENDEDYIDNSVFKSKNKNNIKNSSLEMQENNNKNQIYNNRSTYRFVFGDDSRILNNSIILTKYNEENHNQKDKKYFFILMEYCDGPTLENFINQHSNKTIERKIIYNYIRQILKGLKKLHKNGIIHGDIKPGNIFIKNDHIKIGDFGLSTFKKDTFLQTKDLKGFTPSYAAPEQTNSKIYNEKIDIYATGITLFEMCSCFGTDMERHLALKKLKSKGEVPERISNDYPQETELIKMMTKLDFNERPSAQEILKSNSFIELGKIVNK